MPINTGTAPIAGAETLAVRIETELPEIVRHVTYGRRKPFSSGGRRPPPNAQALDSRVLVSCYNHGERQELIVQLKEGLQPPVAAERISVALKQWFPSPDDAARTADKPTAPTAPVPPSPTPSASASPVPQPLDQLADHADFFGAHADLVKVMERHPLSVIEEVWLRLQAVTELGWEVTIEDGRPAFRRKRQ